MCAIMGLDKVSETICWALEETWENSRLASQNTKPSWTVISPHGAVTRSITCQAHKEMMGDSGRREAWEVQRWWDEAWNRNFIPTTQHRLLYSKLKTALQQAANKEKQASYLEAKYLDAPASASLLNWNKIHFSCFEP